MVFSRTFLRPLFERNYQNTTSKTILETIIWLELSKCCRQEECYQYHLLILTKLSLPKDPLQTLFNILKKEITNKG